MIFNNITRFLTTIILFLTVLNSFSQNEYSSFKYVEDKTYEFYLNKNWDSLIYVGENAIKNRNDYFYLRLRLGVAYFEKHKYFAALMHLEKAYNFNSTDEILLEYLYYAYLYTNRDYDANALSKKFPVALKSKLKIKPYRIFESAYFECGPTFNNNKTKNNKIDYDNTFNIYGDFDRKDNSMYYHFGLTHKIWNIFKIYHGVSLIEIDGNQQIKISDTTRINNNNKTQQKEYYINSEIALGKGFKITPAVHFINVSYSKYLTKTDTIQYFAQPGWDTIKSVKTIYSYNDYIYKLNNSLWSISLSKDYKIFSVSIYVTFSNFSERKQNQFGLSVTTYPFGNLNFYTNSTISFLKQKQGKNIIFDQLIGKKIFSKLWAETYLTFGNMTNYNEKNAFVIYNLSDKLKFKTGINLLFYITKHLDFSLRYQYSEKESTYIYYTNYDSFKTEIVNYSNHTIIGGLKWKF